jgi:glucokinase
VIVAAPVLALDIGGTKLAAGVIAPTGEALGEEREATNPAASPAEILEALFELSETSIDRAGAKWRDLGAVGVSFGGPVDYPQGRTVTCHHLPGWEAVPLRDLVSERAGLPVVMDNDANAAALGEATFGAARGCEHVLYLTVSTGIGGGLVLGGRVYRGANSMAGEIGHTLVAPDGPECTCGRRGCLEAVAAGPGIARAAREALAAGEPSALQDIPQREITAKHVAEAAASDALAARVMAQAGECLGLGIAGAVNLINPQIVVIGGGVAEAGEVLLAPVRESVRQHAVAESVRDLRIVAGELRERGGLLGAAALALTETAQP